MDPIEPERTSKPNGSTSWTLKKDSTGFDTDSDGLRSGLSGSFGSAAAPDRRTSPLDFKMKFDPNEPESPERSPYRIQWSPFWKLRQRTRLRSVQVRSGSERVHIGPTSSRRIAKFWAMTLECWKWNGTKTRVNRPKNKIRESADSAMRSWTPGLYSFLIKTEIRPRESWKCATFARFL